MLSNSFGLQANAKNFISINSLDDLSKIENLHDKKLLILGAGTNVILDDYFDGKGTLYNRKGEIKYSGNFKMGRRHGEGWSYNNDIVELSNFKNDIKFVKQH